MKAARHEMIRVCWTWGTWCQLGKKGMRTPRVEGKWSTRAHSAWGTWGTWRRRVRRTQGTGDAITRKGREAQKYERHEARET